MTRYALRRRSNRPQPLGYLLFVEDRTNHPNAIGIFWRPIGQIDALMQQLSSFGAHDVKLVDIDFGYTEGDYRQLLQSLSRHTASGFWHNKCDAIDQLREAIAERDRAALEAEELGERAERSKSRHTNRKHGYEEAITH